jgi:hypothetical protein
LGNPPALALAADVPHGPFPHASFPGLLEAPLKYSEQTQGPQSTFQGPVELKP